MAQLGRPAHFELLEQLIPVPQPDQIRCWPILGLERLEPVASMQKGQPVRPVQPVRWSRV